ncbi:MAG TPA: hypothetical protein VGQ69_03085 [Gemmatimonadales bacterium]|jgi:hypothetical protein|nr:hypothetical protein [Gemmatimonadales bacterium]
MSEQITQAFARARVRASPHYRLEPSQSAAAGSNPEQSVWAASLLPAREDWRRAQLISRETAELLLALREPGPLPGAATPHDGARLVLDGILELETAGGFCSGPEAYRRFFSGELPVVRGALAELSLAALRCAAALAVPEPELLSKCLYRYNTRPVSPAWLRRFPDAQAVAGLFQAARRGQVESSWTTFLNLPAPGVSWRAWEQPDAPTPAPGAPTYKLYISPAPASVGAATRAVLALAGKSFAPFALKAGHDLPTLLRSEKLVVYFRARDDLFEAADRLRPALGGMAAQGVPFTSELFGDGLVSWGVDPGSTAEPPGPLRQASWRRWITARLGSAMAAALAAGSTAPAWQYAIDRVRLDGVTPETWTAPAWFAVPGTSDADH